MQSHRRPRGKIAFESFCAVCVGASFVGAWIQTGAWAFLAPAFVFTLFGLYWSFDLMGSRQPSAAAAAEPEAAPVAVAHPQPPVAAAEEIRFERFELPAEAEHQTAATPYVEPEIEAEPEPVVEAKPKRRSKKAVAEAKLSAPPVAEPVADPEPVFGGDSYNEPHIEQLFDPQPFARQARPAFGKRPRGPGPRPLPA